MLNFFALNKKQQCHNSQHQINAQLQEEALLESEFYRAVALKKAGKLKAAKTLFQQLIGTEILMKVHLPDASQKLFVDTAYECYKNMANIEENCGNMKTALFCYAMAAQLCDRDVNLIYNMGRLALRLEMFDVAQFAFQSCMNHSEMHFAAQNENLKVYIRDKRWLQMLGFAFCINVSSQLPINTHTNLLKMLSPQGFHLRLKEQKVMDLTRHNLTYKILNNSRNSIPVAVECYVQNEDSAMLFNLQKDTSYLMSLGSHINSNLKSQSHEVEMPIVAISNFIESIRGNGFLAISDNTSKAKVSEDDEEFSSEASKPKSRRRCSDLKQLEQWGWHKNKKYSSRKKSQPGVSDNAPNTLYGLLKNIFHEHLCCSSTSKSEAREEVFQSTERYIKCTECQDAAIFEGFEADAERIVCKLTESKALFLDLQQISHIWMDYSSLFWNKKLSQKMVELYINIFENYINKFGFLTSDHLSTDAFEPTYRICLQYLELKSTRSLIENSSVTDLWLPILEYLMSHWTFASSELAESHRVYYIRLLNAKYLYYNIMNEIDNCIYSLKIMEMYLNDKGDDLQVHVPNLTTFCLSHENVQKMRHELEKRARLLIIPELYANEQWTDMCSLITEHIDNSWRLHTSADWWSDFRQLNEMLLHSLWKANLLEECAIWAEKYIYHLSDSYVQKSSNRLDVCVSSMEYALSYIESLTLIEKCDAVGILKSRLSRLVQSLVTILSYCFDEETEANSLFKNELKIRSSWIILHQILVRTENIEKETKINSEMMSPPKMFTLLFTAHEYMGKHQICSKDSGRLLKYALDFVIQNLKSALYDSCNDVILEFLEQITHCLFAFPSKRTRSKHLEDHNAKNIELTWTTAADLFGIYSPDKLPEFNSYKSESISSDMEQFCLRILRLMPNQQEHEALFSVAVRNNVEGRTNIPLDEINHVALSYQLKNIYYLLGDYYFKTADFHKAIAYYMLDLNFNSSRFDSWVGLSLAKASCIETQLNELAPFNIKQILAESEDIIKCFNNAISILKNHVLLWIEYGSFAYIISSLCSRSIKSGVVSNSKWHLFLEDKKRIMLNRAHNCFSLSATLQQGDTHYAECFEDRWLCQYMLGKISEKREENPNIYLKFYLTAATCLSESNTVYPAKINHGNPLPLTIEAHEIFYRTNAAILKYIQKTKEIEAENIRLFKDVLMKLSNEPTGAKRGFPKKDCASPQINESPYGSMLVSNHIENSTLTHFLENQPRVPLKPNCDSDIRTFTSSNLSGQLNLSMTLQPSLHEICKTEEDDICKTVIANLEGCILRFPEHFKSAYRLAYFYIHGPERFKNLDRGESLLIGQYRTGKGETINGIFYDRKQSNLFNGIWRVPSSEIDRPGSFSSHIIKCCHLLIELLRMKSNYNALSDIVFQLYRTPDPDKRYMLDEVRISLCDLAMRYCNEIIRALLKPMAGPENNGDILSLLIEIYKIQKKCSKHMPQNDKWLLDVFMEVYMALGNGNTEHFQKEFCPLEAATKLCAHEINLRKIHSRI